MYRLNYEKKNNDMALKENNSNEEPTTEGDIKSPAHALNLLACLANILNILNILNITVFYLTATSMLYIRGAYIRSAYIRSAYAL